MVCQILVLPDFPAADSGAGQRSRLLLEAAAQMGPVHIAILADHIPQDAKQQLPDAASIRPLGRGNLTLKGIVRHIPHGALRLLSPKRFCQADPIIKARLEELIAETTAKTVLFRYISTYCVTGLARRKALAVIVDVDDRDDQKYETRLKRLLGFRLTSSAFVQLQLQRLARMLQDKLTNTSLIWFAGRDDIWTLPGVRTAVLPNVAIMNQPQRLPPPSEGQSVLFIGISAHIPNQDGVRWFLDQCWPALVSRFPKTRLRIVGRGLFWQKMADSYPNLAGVDFVGPVEDLSSEYAHARVCICPVREGGGSKIKVIEAAAYGRPIVGVHHAFRGFNEEILSHAFTADSAREFINGCAKFISDPMQADAAGSELKQWQSRHHDRSSAIARIVNDIRTVAPIAGGS